jgi:hypothetical protein
VAKLADAPDLGLRNHRFQNNAFPFKSKCFYEVKTAVSAISRNAANGEQTGARSSINSSTGLSPSGLWSFPFSCEQVTVRAVCRYEIQFRLTQPLALPSTWRSAREFFPERSPGHFKGAQSEAHGLPAIAGTG